LLSKGDGKDGLGGLYTLVNCKLQCRRPLSEKQRLISFNLCLTCWLPCGTVQIQSYDTSGQAKTSLREAQLFVG